MANDMGEATPAVLVPAVAAPEPKLRSRKPVRSVAKVLAFAAIMYFFVVPVIPGFGKAAQKLREVNPFMLVVGLALECTALYCYSLLTKAALGDSGRLVSSWRLFRIQMSTKALGGVVPGGSAANSALGYRLMTLSGVPGPDAGFALGTAGLGSAVVLNLIFWVGLIVSIPLNGVNGAYVSAAIAGVLIMGLAAAIVFGLMEGQVRAEKVLRWIARRLRQNEDRAGDAVRHIGGRLEELVSDRALLGRVVGWAAANWLLDAAALWVFLRAYGGSLSIDGLIVAFGLANIAAVVPITPGGLGIVEGVYIPTLVGFGLTRVTASLGVASYRFAQLFFPIVLGGLLYLTLRVGPWRIERQQELKRLRDVANESTTEGESSLEFHERFSPRRPRSDDSIELERHHPELFDILDDYGDDDAD
ncbi:MAG TPA: lysylphosphatidylglycerol synthase transmembrane domain-containing protein [Ilumatobacteraceae bacterium]